MEETKKVEKNVKEFTILNYSIWRLLVYFVVYSFIGFFIETIYGMFTKGLIESRQSFLYGPFCAIYGLGAIIMILFLQFFNKNNNRLFFGGFIIGSIIEYLVSLFGELMLHVKWWDYSDMPFNLNGRICVFFSIFWGFLGIYLMSYMNPKIDKIIEYVKSKCNFKVLKITTITVVAFLVADCAITVYALAMFFTRIVHENNLNVANKEVIDLEYEKIYSNPKKVAIIEKLFNDKKMIKTFPNLKMQDLDGTIIYFNYYVPDVQPYYYKLNKNLRGDLVKILKDEGENIENRLNGKD